MTLHLRYGVTRRITTKTEHKNGSITIEGDWEANNLHRRILRTIYKVERGWKLTGYCLDRKFHPEAQTGQP